MPTEKEKTAEKLLDNWAKWLQIVQYTSLPNYDFQEVYDPNATDIDIFVCLSGRTTFNGDFVSSDRLEFAATKREIRSENIDLADTRRRMLGTIYLARQAYLKSERQKKVFIFFNGTKEHNSSLVPWLQQHKYFDLPSDFFVVCPISLENTLGQIVGLNVYINKYMVNQNLEGARLRLFVCTSSYHVPRAALALGENSPILSSKFWLSKRSRKAVTRLVYDENRAVLQDKFSFLRNAVIEVIGVDRFVMERPAAEQDINSEKFVLPIYTMMQDPPSMPQLIGANVLTFSRAMERMALSNERWLKNYFYKNDSDKLGFRYTSYLQIKSKL